MVSASPREGGDAPNPSPFPPRPSSASCRARSASRRPRGSGRALIGRWSGRPLAPSGSDPARHSTALPPRHPRGAWCSSPLLGERGAHLVAQLAPWLRQPKPPAERAPSRRRRFPVRPCPGVREPSRWSRVQETTGGDHLAHLLGWGGGRLAGPGSVLEPREALLVVPSQPEGDGLGVDPRLPGDGGDLEAFPGQPDGPGGSGPERASGSMGWSAWPWPRSCSAATPSAAGCASPSTGSVTSSPPCLSNPLRTDACSPP